MKAQDESKISRQLEVVEKWRASGQSKNDWSAAHGMDAKQLMGWITYEGRWRARLNGQQVMPHKRPLASASAASHNPEFALLRVRSDAIHASDQAPQPSIRIECPKADLVLHWPLVHSTQLIGWIEAFSSAPRGQRPHP